MKALPLSLAALALAASPAQAQWSAPQTVGADAPAGLSTVATDARGRVVIAWHADDGTHVLTGGRERVLAGQPAALVPSGAQTFLLLRRREREVLLSTATATGSVHRTARVTRRAEEVDVAANLRGRAAVAWVEAREPDREVVRVRLRDSRGRLGRAITVASGSRVRGVETVVGPGGRVAVLYADTRRRRKRVHARILRPGARSFGRELLVGTHAGQARIRAAYGASGRLYVGWEHQDIGEEANRPLAVHASTLGRTGRRFAREEVVDRGDAEERTTGRIDLVVTPGEGATLAWTMVLDGFRFEARTAHAGRTGRFGEPLTLAPDSRLGDLDVGPTGEVWALMDRGPDVLAAVKTAATDFGAPELVATDEFAALPAVAARAGRPVAVWTGLGGPSPRVRVSVRG